MTNKKIVSVYIQDDLLVRAKEKGISNLSAWICAKLIEYINEPKNVHCNACGAEFSDNTWARLIKPWGICINCNSKVSG